MQIPNERSLKSTCVVCTYVLTTDVSKRHVCDDKVSVFLVHKWGSPEFKLKEEISQQKFKRNLLAAPHSFLSAGKFDLLFL